MQRAEPITDLVRFDNSPKAFNKFICACRGGGTFVVCNLGTPATVYFFLASFSATAACAAASRAIGTRKGEQLT